MCPPDVNPAEYMLEAIGAGVTPRVGDRDWKDVWSESPEYQRVKEEIAKIKADGLAKSGSEGEELSTCKSLSHLLRRALTRRQMLHLSCTNFGSLQLGTTFRCGGCRTTCSRASSSVALFLSSSRCPSSSWATASVISSSVSSDCTSKPCQISLMADCSQLLGRRCSCCGHVADRTFIHSQQKDLHPRCVSMRLPSFHALI